MLLACLKRFLYNVRTQVIPQTKPFSQPKDCATPYKIRYVFACSFVNVFCIETVDLFYDCERLKFRFVQWHHCARLRDKNASEIVVYRQLPRARTPRSHQNMH